MLTIRETGVEDYIDGSANIKALIIGGPGAGKTRMSSFWPKPIFLDCENGRGSLADRKMPYVEVRNSKDMLDALEYLKGLERTPKAQRQFQTVVVDTADSFQRVVKDEWVRQTQAGSFSGYDAWGYLDTKMQLLFTRLLNLDYNVIVLVHYKDKTYKDGDNNVRELTLQLQGAISDQIFNDFGLVGWLGTYWEAGEEGRVQKRGLTFQPTPDKPFLKDRFHVTPKWMQIDFTDNDYQQLFEAFFNRPEFEEMEQGAVVGQIPDADDRARTAPEGVTRPAEGGPLPPRPPVEVPLEKMVKAELEDIAKDLGLQVRGNMLKVELVEAIKAKRSEPKSGDAAGEKQDPPAASPSQKDTGGGFTVTEGFNAPKAMAKIAEATEPDPTSPAPSSESSTAVDADAAAASSEPSAPLTEAALKKSLGAEVLSREDTSPPPVARPATPAGPADCADCGNSLKDEWAVAGSRDYIRLSKAKHKRYLCSTCHKTASANQ